MRIRAGFVAEPGCLFVGADYSQVELRLLAHLSGDTELTRGFLEGEDIHAATACGVFGVTPPEVTPELRRRAKVINFGILYGMSPFGLSRELRIGGREAKEYIDHYCAATPGGTNRAGQGTARRRFRPTTWRMVPGISIPGTGYGGGGTDGDQRLIQGAADITAGDDPHRPEFREGEWARLSRWSTTS
jgi:hypothetical protein